MMSVLSQRTLGIAAAIVMGVVSSASAQTAPEVAEACIEAVQHRAERAGEQISAVRRATVEAIRTLDDQGAPDAVLVAAASEGRDAVNRRALDASQDISRIVARCIGELEDLDAPAILIHRVRAAGVANRTLVHMHRDRALAVITLALRRALED